MGALVLPQPAGSDGQGASPPGPMSLLLVSADLGIVLRRAGQRTALAKVEAWGLEMHTGLIPPHPVLWSPQPWCSGGGVTLTPSWVTRRAADWGSDPLFTIK